ncbi:MAG: hypothetical protein IJV07_00275 [Alphaproteobacteria bacterium]|nr:hypothetical protein [Alphaproteobacteria bacterium]
MNIYIADLSKIDFQPDILKKYQSLLTDTELERYHRMSAPLRQKQFLIGRVLIQSVCHQSPRLSETGKPVLTDGYISLAHSGPYVVLATAEYPVGIDIEEMIKDKDFYALSARLNFELNGDIQTSFYKQFTRFEADYKLSDPVATVYHAYYRLGDFLVCLASVHPISASFFQMSSNLSLDPIQAPVFIED